MAKERGGKKIDTIPFKSFLKPVGGMVGCRRGMAGYWNVYVTGVWQGMGRGGFGRKMDSSTWNISCTFKSHYFNNKHGDLVIVSNYESSVQFVIYFA